MWEAVTAVFSICVRAGKGGAFTGLGELLTYSSYANRRAPVVLTSRTRRSGEYIPDGKFGSGGNTISGWECFFGGHIIASYDGNKKRLVHADGITSSMKHCRRMRVARMKNRIFQSGRPPGLAMLISQRILYGPRYY